MKPRILSTARLSFTLASAIAAMIGTQSAQAVDFWWDGGTNNWTTNTAWSTVAGAATPDPTSAPSSATTDDLFFNITGVNTANVISLAGGNRAAKSLTFNSTGTSIFRANASGTTTARTLSIGTGGIIINSGAGAVTIGDTPATYGAINISLSGAQTWTNNSSNTFNLAGTVTNGTNLLTIDGSGATTLSGVIGNGTGGFTKSGAGTLIMSGTNTYTGNTTISGGILRVNVAETAGTSGPMGNKAANAAGSILMTGGTLQFTSSNTNDYSGRFSTAGSQTWNIDTNSLSVTFATALQGTSSSLNKSGGGTLTLSGNNSYTGGTTLSGGILAVTTNSNVLGTGNVSINGGTRLTVDGGLTLPNNNNITLTSSPGATGRGVIESSGTGTATISGNITINGLATAGGHFASSTGNDLVLSGMITSSVLVSQRIGTVTYSGGGTGYANFSVNQGTAKVGALNGIATTAAVDIGASGTAILDLNGYNQSLVGITKSTNAATIGNSSTTANSTLTLTGTSSYAGTIVDVVGSGTKTVALKVDSSGTLTLSGANTYTGGTTLNAGTVSFTSTGLGSSGNITFSGNSTVQWGTSTTTDLSSRLVINNGITATLDTGANNVTLATGFGASGSGALTKSGSGTMTLSGTNTYTGTTTISAGRLLFAKQVSLYNNNNASWTASNIIVGNGGSLGLNVGGTGEFTTTDVTTLLTNLGGANGTSTTGFAAGSSIAFDTTNASGGTFTVADAIANSTGTGGGAIGVVKLGTGTLIFSNTGSTFSGPITVSGGTLRLPNVVNPASVTVGASTLSLLTDTAISSAASLNLTGAATVAVDRVTSGAGITHIFGGTSVFTHNTLNFTASNVASGYSAIQLGNVTNGSGSGGTTTLNPTTANLIITGNYTGANTGTSGLNMGGTSQGNRIDGNIALGTRTTINVTKSNTSIWTLSGTNTGLNGTLNVTGGALITTNLLALPNSGSATFGGGTVGVVIGTSPTNWSTGEVDTFLAAGTTIKTSGALGLDTRNADLTQWTAFTTGNFGPLGLAKLGANKLTLNLANTYTGATTIDQGTLELTTNDLTTSSALNFGFGAGNTSNTGSLDMSTVNATFGALNVLTNSATSDTITIGSGKTLLITGAVTMGYSSATTNSNSNLTATGSGTLSIGTSVTPTNANFTVGAGNTNLIANNANLDVSGLPTFYANLGTGTFRVGNATANNPGSASTVILAGNSTIVATNLIVASRDGSGTTNPTQTLRLGSGTNVLNVGTINVAGVAGANDHGRSNGTLNFNTANGTLTVRGLSGGTTRSTLNIGYNSMNTAAQITGLFDATGHNTDLRLGTMTVGARTTQTTGGAGFTATGTFNFNTGTLDADDLTAGLVTNLGSATGTVNLGGGTSTFNSLTRAIVFGDNNQAAGTVGSGTLNIFGGSVTVAAASNGKSIVLGNATGAGAATGALNLTGGTLTVAGDILRGATTGTSSATLTLSGGSLDMGGKNIGSGSAAVTLTAESGTLKNVASINGTGGLTKTTAGTLTIDGTNTYTGNTIINGGTLALADNAQLKFVTGSTSGTNNGVSGTGTLTLDGDFVIDTTLTDATALTSGTWTLVDNSTLTETFSATFTVIGFNDIGSNKWQKTVGSKKYTFDEATGILTLSSAASYASWIDGFFPGETNSAIIGATADPDGDGISNAVEMVIGGNPKDGMDTALLPTIELVTNPVGSPPTIPAGDYLLFTYRRSAISETSLVTAACETDTDLVAPWTTAINASSGVVIQEDTNFSFTPAAPADTDRVRVYVPRGANTTLFGRLNVQVP